MKPAWSLLFCMACASGPDSATTTTAPTGLPSTGDPTTTTSSCFVTGTPVRTPHGDVPIESLTVGSAVLAWSLQTDRPAVRHVTEVFRHTAPLVLELAIGDAVLQVTPEHPIYRFDDARWVEAGDLQVGDTLGRLRRTELERVPISRIGRVPGQHVVHNLSVGGAEHTYFADSVLVHNKIVPPVIWTDVDGEEPRDINGDGISDQGCGDSVHISIRDPLGATDWSFGMAGANWLGEDCLAGQDTTQICHPIGVEHTLQQVCDPADLVAGQTSLFGANDDTSLTYYLADGSGYCAVFGADVAYYDALGCQEL